MKLTCLQENLNKGLGVVSRAVATRTTLPITNNVLLSAKESRLKLSATNLEMAVMCWVGAKVEEEGAITVPARLFMELVNSLPNDLIGLSLSRHVLELKCARLHSHINGIDAEDFPPISVVEDGLRIQIEAEALRTAISHVVFVTASEDTRPVLTGVHIEIENDTITLAAADGFRLAVYQLPLTSSVDEKVEFIVPGRTLTELLRLIGEQEEPVELIVNPARGQASFKLKNAEMTTQLIQGSFPNYRQLIPQNYETRAVVNVKDFLKAVKTASIFARDASGIVRLMISMNAEGEGTYAADLGSGNHGGNSSESETTITQVAPRSEALALGKVSIISSSEQVGDNVSEIDASVERLSPEQSELARIAFNCRYLSEVLSALHEEQIALEITTPSSAGVIRPVGSDNYVYVIMPMFVQW